MGGGASRKIEEIDNTLATRQNAELSAAVEEFTEQAYLDGSKVDGLKLILNNPNARKAFIKFLNSENGTENLQFFQDMEGLRRTEEKTLAAESKAIVDKYQKPKEVADVGLTDNVSASIDGILAKDESSSASDASKSGPESAPPPSTDSASQADPLKSSVAETGKESAGPKAVDVHHAGLGNENFLLDAMLNATNETMVIIALNVFPNFIGSQAYKDWREQEARLAAETAAAKTSDPSAANAVAAIPTTAAASTGSTALVPVASESFAAKSAEFIKPTEIDRIFGNGSWIGTFVSAAEALPICVTLADADPKNPNFPLLYVNKVFESMTGFARERIRGTNCKFLQGPKSEPESISLLSNALANQQPVKVAITNYRIDKTPFKNLLAMKPVFDLDGRYCYVVGVQFDISAPGSNAKAMKLVDSLVSLLPNVIPSGGFL